MSCVDYVLYPVDIDFLARVIRYGYFHFLVTVTVLLAGRILERGKRLFLLQNANTASGAHSASYVTGAKFLYRGLNQRGRDADQSNAADKKEWSYTYTAPIRLHGADWDNFTFLYETTKSRQKTVSFVMSVRPFIRLSARNDSVPIRRIFMKFGI